MVIYILLTSSILMVIFIVIKLQSLKGFLWIYGEGCFETFAHIELNLVTTIISIMKNLCWLLHQLDVKVLFYMVIYAKKHLCCHFPVFVWDKKENFWVKQSPSACFKSLVEWSLTLDLLRGHLPFMHGIRKWVLHMQCYTCEAHYSVCQNHNFHV